MKRMRIPLLVCGMLCCAPHFARATTALVASVSITTPAESLRVRETRVAKKPHLSPQASPARATMLSLGSTVIPVAAGFAIANAGDHVPEGTLLVVGGVIVGPAVGYFDSGLYARGTRGIALRLATGLFALSAVSSLIGDDSDVGGPVLIFIGGVGGTAVLAIVDCALVGHDVARAQAVSIAPVILPGARAPGVGVTIRF